MILLRGVSLRNNCMVKNTTKWMTNLRCALFRLLRRLRARFTRLRQLRGQVDRGLSVRVNDLDCFRSSPWRDRLGRWLALDGRLWLEIALRDLGLIDDRGNSTHLRKLIDWLSLLSRGRGRYGSKLGHLLLTRWLLLNHLTLYCYHALRLLMVKHVLLLKKESNVVVMVKW